jgi:MFS family permease
MATEKTASWFYGWNVIGVGVLAQGVAMGATAYSYGVFIKPLEVEFEASRLATVLGMSVFNAAMGLVSPFVGSALDRGSIRAVMVRGALLMGVGFGAIAYASALWQVGAVYAAAVAAGATMLGPIAGSTLATNWFNVRRGQALGISALGTSLGGLLIPPLAAFLIETLGWRSAFQVLGLGVVALIVPPIWLIVVNRPEHRGLWPDGVRPDGLDPGRPVVEARTNWTTGRILRDRSFWVLTITVGLIFSGFGALMANLVPLARDQGVGAQPAAYLMSCLAGFGVLGKLAFGTAADHIDKRVALWTAIGLAAASLSLLLGEASYARMLVASAGFGLSSGGLLPVWGSLIGLRFGRDSFGRVMGLMYPVMMPLTLTGAPFAGWVFDRTGSYSLAFQVFLGAFALAALVLVFLRVPEAADASN